MLDPLVPVARSREWQRRLLDLHSPVEYIEYPAVAHNAWDSAYAKGEIFEWFGTTAAIPTPTMYG